MTGPGTEEDRDTPAQAAHGQLRRMADLGPTGPIGPIAPGAGGRAG